MRSASSRLVGYSPLTLDTNVAQSATFVCSGGWLKGAARAKVSGSEMFGYSGWWFGGASVTDAGAGPSFQRPDYPTSPDVVRST
jgi:hypothetical protein